MKQDDKKSPTPADKKKDEAKKQDKKNENQDQIERNEQWAGNSTIGVPIIKTKPQKNGDNGSTTNQKNATIKTNLKRNPVYNDSTTE